MKRIIILIIAIIPIMVYAKKKPVSGIYKSKTNGEVHIIGNTFKYYAAEGGGLAIYYDNLLAECDITWIGNNFMELNSPDPIFAARITMKITQSSVNNLTADSIKVVFDIPYKYKRLKISLYDANAVVGEIFNFYFSEKNKEIMIPNSVKKISFLVVEPESIGAIDIIYLGLIYFHTYLDIDIKDNTNYIKIDIPALDNHYFEKYYIKEEYVRVINNKIIWRGEVFKKMKE